MSTVLLAELACLAAALSWATSLPLFRAPIGDYGARAVNLCKCVLATVLLGVTAAVLGDIAPLLAAAPRDLALVAASGVVGLSFGDTALMAAVRLMGVYRTLLLQSLAPLFTVVLAAAFLGERLSWTQGLGAAVALSGVCLVVLQRGQVVAPQRCFTPRGVVYGLLAAIGQGAGIVLAKQGMAHIAPLPASFLRLGASSLGLAVAVALAGRLRSALALLAAPASLGRIGRPTLIGTYLGILLMMAGIAGAPASVAAVLLATTPIFSLLIDARVTGEPLRARSVAGTLLAITGVALLTAATG